MDANVTYPQNNDGNHQPNYFSVNSEEKEGNNWQCRTCNRYTVKSTVKVFQGLFAFEVAYPPAFVQNH